MAGVRPEPPAAFSALAIDQVEPLRACDQAGDGAVHDPLARLADDVADEEESHVHARGCDMC